MEKLTTDQLTKIQHADTLIQVARDLLAAIPASDNVREALRATVSATIAVHHIRLEAEKQ